MACSGWTFRHRSADSTNRASRFPVGLVAITVTCPPGTRSMYDALKVGELVTRSLTSLSRPPYIRAIWLEVRLRRFYPVGSLVARWRRWPAHLIMAGHSLSMCVLFVFPFAVLLRVLATEHPQAARLVGGLMATGFLGSLWLAPRLLPVSPNPARRGTTRRALLRLYRMFVGNGDAIQGLARRIDPAWQNPHAGRTPHETAYWLASKEVPHWALLVASVAPVAAALWYGHYVLGLVCLAATVFYNLAPNLVMRDTRQRLLRLSGRTAAAGTNCDRLTSVGGRRA